MKVDKYVFKRHEIKYKLTPEQYVLVLQEINRHMSVDEYGETTIQSLYYDTDNYRLIRESIERPFYKEKLRARSYGLATPDQKIFLELKKKCDKVVFKRRIRIQENKLSSFIVWGIGEENGQIEKEIRYFCKFYGGVKPSMLLLYDRTAYYGTEDDGLRITFDKNVRYRTERLSLCAGLDGTLLLPSGEIMMEVKTTGAYPSWLVRLLNENAIYKTSFSKYGTAYQIEQRKQIEEGTKEKAV